MKWNLNDRLLSSFAIIQDIQLVVDVYDRVILCIVASFLFSLFVLVGLFVGLYSRSLRDSYSIIQFNMMCVGSFRVPSTIKRNSLCKILFLSLYIYFSYRSHYVPNQTVYPVHVYRPEKLSKPLARWKGFCLPQLSRYISFLFVVLFIAPENRIDYMKLHTILYN